MTSIQRTSLRNGARVDPKRLATLLVRISIGTALMALMSWLVLELVAPSVLRDAYEGRSVAILNSLISGQRDHPVSEYLSALSGIARTVALALLALAATLSVLASATRYASLRRPVALLFTFLIAVAVLAPLVLSMEIGIFDEGFVVSGAMLIRQGALPIRDFFVIYGPGQYYLTAGVFALFSEDLMVSRFLHVLLLALLGVAVAACTSTLVPRSRVWPALAALVYLFASGILWMNPGYAAIPAALLLLCACLAFAHWAETENGPSLFGASLLVGLAGVFRWDFGVFGLLALTLTTGGLLVARSAARSLAGRLLAAAIAPGLALTVLVFTPFILVGNAARWFDEVPLFHLLEFKTWRNLEFIKPTVWSAERYWSAGNTIGFNGAIAHLAYAAVAPCAALTAILIAGRRAWRGRGEIDGADALALLLGLMTLFFLNQMRARSGFPQGFPALVASLPLTAYVLAAMPTRGLAQRAALTALSTALAAVLIFAPLHVMQQRLRDVIAGPVSGGVDLPRATTLRLNRSPQGKKTWNEYADLVQHVRATTRQGEPILSAVADTSRLFINDAMLYFLVDRPAATRWVEMEPGLTNTEQGQRELIAALEDRSVRTIVLLTWTSNEPNATSRSNGIHLFDEYIRRTFVSSRKFGAYEVLVRRGT